MSATQETHAATEKVESKNGRDANGRFAPGNPGGPGNPYARKVAEMRKTMVEFVSIEKLKRIVEAITKKAEEGDVAAAKLIFQYVLGKPTTPVDPDRLDVDERQKLLERARPPREMSAVLNSVPADLASRLTNTAWPCSLETKFLQPFSEGLKKLDERDARRANAAAKKKAGPAAAPKGNGDDGCRATVAGVSDPGHGNAPKRNGSNGAPGVVGVAPIPNLQVDEDEEWLRRIAREMFPDGPSTNGHDGSESRR